MFLGIDLGSSSAKALLIGPGYKHKAKADYPAGFSPYLQPAAVVFGCVAQAVRDVLGLAGANAADIEAVGLCGHGPSIVFSDEAGNALTDILTWQDTRALGEAAFLRESWPGFEKDGTSYEAKLLWYHKNQPELFRPGVQALYPKDYLIQLLCGRRVMDSSTASVVCYWDGDAQKWDMGGTGIPASVMPQVAPSWEVAGQCGTEFSRQCGLGDGTPVVAGGIDSFVEAVGAGGFLPGTAVDGSGTSTVLTRSVALQKGLAGHVLKDSSLLVHMMSSTGGSWHWFRALFPGDKLPDLQAGLHPRRPVNLLYLPYLDGERSPVFDERATGVFVGLRPGTDKFQLLQAIYQGVAFGVTQNLRNMGDGLQRVRAVGGINKDDAWVQIKANASGLIYEQMDEPDAGALGAALLAAMAMGHPGHELDKWTQVRRVFTPQPEYQAEYQALYGHYTALYHDVKGHFEGLYLLRPRLEGPEEQID